MNEAMKRLNARTCIKNFLTQRAVQSFMFLQEQCRDPHTVDWIEKFTETSHMLQFHGTGGMNLQRFDKWDIFFMDMMEAGPDEVVITVKQRGGGIGGWSPNNPHLKDRTTSYTVDIDPPTLASRILAVREQLAKEFNRDLDIIANNGELVIESYFENRRKERNSEEYKEGERPDKPNEQTIHSSSEQASQPKFNRDTMRTLINLSSNQGYSFSPLRVGSFDLLLLLCTQESIHRVMNILREEGPESEVTFQWFLKFYVERAPKFFDGNGNYGRYDDFLDELLSCSPTVQKNGKKMQIVDPIGLAEKVILMRTDVASEWRELMNQVPLHHMDLRRNLLDRQIEDVDLVEDTVTHIEDMGSGVLFWNNTNSEFE